MLVECTIRIDDDITDSVCKYVWRDIKPLGFDASVGLTIATCLRRFDCEGDAIIRLAHAVTDFEDEDWPESTDQTQAFIAAARAVLDADEIPKTPLDTAETGG